MKKFLSAGPSMIGAMLLAGALWFPVAGLAQVYNNNKIGLYTDLSADPASTSIFVEPNVLFDVFLIVTNPVNEEFTPPDCGPPIQRDISLIDAVGFRIYQSGAGLNTMAVTPNGTISHQDGDPPDYVFRFSDPVPVPDNGAVHLVTFTFMVDDTDPRELFLHPTVSFNYDNNLWIWDGEEISPGPSGLNYRDYPEPCPWDGARQLVIPVSGGFWIPVFGINTSVVLAENESFGSVKALYR